jgi:Dolichyl-phosphate-mannose-protein mannosyltransferase
MNHLARQTQVWLCVFLSCLGFLMAGCVLLPYAGIQNDEALVAGPIFGPVARDFRIRIFHRDIPLMAMDYVGALKSWLYWPIFRLTQPSPTSLRLPVLLIGALTIWLFYRLLEKIAGPRAAVTGCLLLATDTTFLLTTEFDWGPVAIQHLMLVAACLFLFEFERTGSSKFLAAGFLALGLGLWDKALFAWLLGGLSAAAAVVFPREVFARLTAKNLGVALAGFLLGVWPLAVFNARHQWRTIGNHASFSAQDLAGKSEVLQATLNGSGLFGYMVNESPSQLVKQPQTWLEQGSTRVADSAGQPHRNFLLPALLLSLAAGLLGGSRRAILFALVFMAATWILMALTRNAGGSVHHAVLLWPFPQLVVAIACAGLSRKWARWGRAACALAIAVLCATNLLVTNQYLAQFIRNGPTVTWTDAIYPLSDSLRKEPADGFVIGDVFVMDWGIFNPLLLLHQGLIRIHVGFDAPMNPTPGAQERRMIDGMLSSTRAVFVAHTPGNEFFPAANRRFLMEAASRGYRKQLLHTVADRHGREVFEVYRFVRE